MKNYKYLKLIVVLCLIGCLKVTHSQSHLVLSEITLAPSTGEFIEIYNPTNDVIDLQGYYLADNSGYAGLPEGGLMIALGDFIVSFPAGYTIQPNQVIVIAMGGTDFTNEYIDTPDFEIVSQSASIPDMVFNAGSGTPALTNAGEAVVLFYWDGLSDLVKDVDIIYAGTPNSSNMLPPKTGVSIDGPDADAITSTYFADTATLPVQYSFPDIGFSTKRILPETGYEIAVGGNGITGNDETSENTLVTWDSAYTAPNPGVTELSTNVREVADTREIIFFPNPARDYLTVENTGNARLMISGMDGKLLHDEEINGSQKLDISDYALGTYFVLLQKEQNIHVGRMVKH